MRKKVPRDTVAQDGKTLRASRAEGQPALHQVSAFSTTNRLVLGQRAADGKSNEITAIPELLKVLDQKGCIVALDAMGCQRDIAKKIVAKKADYILIVKGNQAGLHKAIQRCFQALDAAPHAMTHFVTETTERHHGRQETRRVTTLNAVAYLPEEQLTLRGPSRWKIKNDSVETSNPGTTPCARQRRPWYFNVTEPAGSL